MPFPGKKQEHKVWNQTEGRPKGHNVMRCCEMLGEGVWLEGKGVLEQVRLEGLVEGVIFVGIWW